MEKERGCVNAYFITNTPFVAPLNLFPPDKEDCGGLLALLAWNIANCSAKLFFGRLAIQPGLPAARWLGATPLNVRRASKFRTVLKIAPTLRHRVFEQLGGVSYIGDPATHASVQTCLCGCEKGLSLVLAGATLIPGQSFIRHEFAERYVESSHSGRERCRRHSYRPSETGACVPDQP